MNGFQRIASLHELPPMKAITSDAFPASFTDKVRKVNDVNVKNKLLTLKNKLQTIVGARLLDGPAPVRRFMIRRFILEAGGMQQVLRDEGQLAAYIRHATVGVWHCSCTCRMGSEDNSMAVTFSVGAGPRGARVAGCRRLDIPDNPVREHKPSDDDGGREDCGRNPDATFHFIERDTRSPEDCTSRIG